MAREKINNIDETSQIFLFCILYLISIPLFASILSIFNLRFEDSFMVIIATITNSGIGILEIANLTYYPNSFFEIILLAIVMLFGRIEIFLSMILISGLFWKKI